MTLAITLGTSRVTAYAGDISTASFSVTSGDLLVICYTSQLNCWVSDVTGSATIGGPFTAVQRTGGSASVIDYAPVTGSGTISIQVSSLATCYASVVVYKITGHDPASPIRLTWSGDGSTSTNYTPTLTGAGVSGDVLVFNATDVNHNTTPSSSDLTANAANSVGLAVLSGHKAVTSDGNQSANVQSTGTPYWTYTAVEIRQAPPPVLNAAATSTTTFASTATATTDTPAAVASTTTFASTVTANVHQYVDVSSTTTFGSTTEIPVPRVASTTTFASTVTAFATPPLPAAVASTVTFSSTVTALGMFSAQVNSTTSFRSRVTAHRTGGAQPVVAPYGPLTIGRITLTEPIDVDQKSGDTRTITLSGVDADQAMQHPTQAQIRARMEALLAYAGQVVPVTFSAFPHLDGWYQIGSPGAGEFGWYDTTSVEWSVDLTRVGSDAESEIESRLVLPPGGRSHVSAAVAEPWHSPPCGADSYTPGATSPGWVTRIGADGVSYVYRALAAGNPRYGVPVARALAGAATATVAGEVRTGLTCPDTPTDWSLSNGLLRVEPRTDSCTLRITSYLTSSWGTPRLFDLRRGTASLGMPAHVTILRNQACEVVLRLTWDNLPGRTTCDLSLRRGSRFVGLHLQQSAVADALAVTDAGPGGIYGVTDLGEGWTTELRDDPDSNRWVVGSTLACSWPGQFGLIADVAARSLSAMIGVVRAGTSAVAGDTAADLYCQWLGSPSETERVIRR